MGTNHFDEITPTQNEQLEQPKGKATKKKWEVSEETHDIIRKAQRVDRKRDKVVLKYEDACGHLGLTLRQFQIFSFSDKQKLTDLAFKFDKWFQENRKTELDAYKLILPFVLFWQQFYFAVVSPSNVSLTGKEPVDCPFNKMPLKNSSLILYIQGHTALDALLLDSEKLHEETGHKEKYQVHFMEMKAHPLFLEFIESI